MAARYPPPVERRQSTVFRLSEMFGGGRRLSAAAETADPLRRKARQAPPSPESGFPQAIRTPGRMGGRRMLFSPFSDECHTP